ncbi:beta-1,6-N-acetylglucosaminyltransferase [Solitalea lacus]|uniref:beta-1,6-N-acetylglucosaminyltransferase n=1 Tax=Solitalea lacus TaxID=2911172 RepID=UPI001EDAD5A4|nr:beta-1,6-N-acetylglucosaminyltransferase [Solitalea lacus]UKJ07493.1 beta-1,6-N-acetylglucosaminyltransferase [Solitalea lacus]
MKAAYLILVHRDFDHLIRIVNSLVHPNVTFFIHVDKKIEFDVDNLSQRMPQNANFFFIEERINVSWGGFSLTYACLELLWASLQHGQYDYFSLLSGQDFPLKSTHEILQFLEDNSGKEFIEHWAIPDPRWVGNGGRDRYEYYWLVDEIGIQASQIFVEIQRNENQKRNLPFNLKPYGGSQWFTITQACAQYIYTYLTDHEEVVDFFQYTLISDEILIPTIVLNSEFKRNVINNNLRYIDWGTGPHPKTLGMSDIQSLLSSNCHFARKFDHLFDADVIQELETRIFKEN